MPKNEIILQVLWKVLSPKKDLAGKKVLVTAGPTREFMDPVRFLSNPSSGKMGFAIAKTAWYRGGEVTLIKGPTCIEPPYGLRVVNVTAAEEMYDAVLKESEKTDIIVKAAAVGDYKFATTSEQKIKRRARIAFRVTLEENPDTSREYGKN